MEKAEEEDEGTDKIIFFPPDEFNGALNEDKCIFMDLVDGDDGGTDSDYM